MMIRVWNLRGSRRTQRGCSQEQFPEANVQDWLCVLVKVGRVVQGQRWVDIGSQTWHSCAFHGLALSCPQTSSLLFSFSAFIFIIPVNCLQLPYIYYIILLSLYLCSSLLIFCFCLWQIIVYLPKLNSNVSFSREPFMAPQTFILSFVIHSTESLYVNQLAVL